MIYDSYYNPVSSTLITDFKLVWSVICFASSLKNISAIFWS